VGKEGENDAREHKGFYPIFGQFLRFWGLTSWESPETELNCHYIEEPPSRSERIDLNNYGTCGRSKNNKNIPFTSLKPEWIALLKSTID
jgi:hypothetical protein